MVIKELILSLILYTLSTQGGMDCLQYGRMDNGSFLVEVSWERSTTFETEIKKFFN